MSLSDLIDEFDATPDIAIEEYEYPNYHSGTTYCHLLIYNRDGISPVVIYSQPEDAEGTSVTNQAEEICASIAWDYDLKFWRSVFIEHYPPSDSTDRRDSWDLVLIDAGDWPSVKEVRWMYIGKNVVESLISNQKG